MSAQSNENNKPSRDLRKHEIAEQLLAKIVGGKLAPGEQISERTWATRFGVAQASIREAINILAHDGFVTKESGRSARVVSLSEEDVVQLYQVRAGLEGIAGYLAAAAAPMLPTCNPSSRTCTMLQMHVTVKRSPIVIFAFTWSSAGSPVIPISSTMPTKSSGPSSLLCE